MAIPYLDAHCDTITRFNSLRRCENNHLDLIRLKKYAPAGQLLAVWAAPGVDGPSMFRRVMFNIRRELGLNADIVALCTSTAEFDAAASEGKIGLFLAVEGGNLLSCSVAGLLDAYRQGVRVVTLCWNRDNRLCGSCNDSGSGLTADGVRFAKACWEKGVAVDLSHASEKTFWDVIRIAERPVLCSHSNAKSICNHPRNLTDAQISAVVHNDGCIGLNLCPDFLGKNASIETICRHADHFLSMDASENLCLGTDFDGIDSTPEGIEGVQDMSKLYEALLKMGLRERLVQDIFFNNFHRFLERAL